MKVLRNGNMLKDYGIEVLTGEACNYGGRWLCDVRTEDARLMLSDFLGVRPITLALAWNRGVGSVMLSPEVFQSFAVHVLLMTGCQTVARLKDGELWGAENVEDVEELGKVRSYGMTEREWTKHQEEPHRGLRNVHQMTGRAV